MLDANTAFEYTDALIFMTLFIGINLSDCVLLILQFLIYLCVCGRERGMARILLFTHPTMLIPRPNKRKDHLQKDLKNHLLTVGFQNTTLLTERFKCKAWGVKRNNNKKDSFFSNFMTWTWSLDFIQHHSSFLYDIS